MLTKIISKARLLFRETPKVPLGRWTINYDDNSELIKQTLASHDHCGACGTPENVVYEEIIKLSIPNKTNQPMNEK